MHLFSQLLRLHKGASPTEDFLTELACAVLRHDAEFARTWLQHIGVSIPPLARLLVRSQISVGGLESHDSDSRVDIVVEIAADDFRDIVFVEAKVTAPEGFEQIRRYAEILSSEVCDVRYRYLIYLTANYDPKSDPGVPDVIFRQARWHEFHRLLSRSVQNPLSKEVLRFMESKGLSQGDRLTAADLVSLRNLKHLVNILEASLSGEVLRELKRLTGRTYLDTSLIKTMRNNGAWVLETRWDESQTGMSIGFVQPDSDDPGAFPIATVLFWVAPKSPHASALRKAIRGAGGDWRPRGLDQSDAWFGMRIERPLEAFLPEPDHVKALQRFFLDGITKAAAWLSLHPQFTAGSVNPGGMPG